MAINNQNVCRIKQFKSLIQLRGALKMIAGLKLSIFRAGGQPSIIIEVIAAVISHSILSSSLDTIFFLLWYNAYHLISFCSKVHCWFSPTDSFIHFLTTSIELSALKFFLFKVIFALTLKQICLGTLNLLFLL